MNQGDHISCQGYRVRWVTTAMSTDKIIFIMCLLSAPCLQFLCFYIKAAVADRHCNILRYSRLFSVVLWVFQDIWFRYLKVFIRHVSTTIGEIWSILVMVLTSETCDHYCLVSMMRLWPFSHILYRIIFVNVSSTS